MELDKKDWENLVRGSQPRNYEQIGSELFNKAGSYCGGMVDGWEWDKVEKCTIEELQEIYRQCKN